MREIDLSFSCYEDAMSPVRATKNEGLLACKFVYVSFGFGSTPKSSCSSEKCDFTEKQDLVFELEVGRDITLLHCIP